MAADERKEYISQIVASNFGKKGKNAILDQLEVEDFLNNGNCMTLVTFLDSTKNFCAVNNVRIGLFVFMFRAYFTKTQNVC